MLVPAAVHKSNILMIMIIVIILIKIMIMLMKVDTMFLVNHFWKVDEGIFHYLFLFSIKVATSIHVMQKCRIRMKMRLIAKLKCRWVLVILKVEIFHDCVLFWVLKRLQEEGGGGGVVVIDSVTNAMKPKYLLQKQNR